MNFVFMIYLFKYHVVLILCSHQSFIHNTTLFVHILN